MKPLKKTPETTAIIRKATKLSDKEEEYVSGKHPFDHSLSEVPKHLIKPVVNHFLSKATDHKYDYVVLFQNKTDDSDKGICLRHGFWDTELIKMLSDHGKYRFKVIPVQKRYPWQR